MKFRALRHYIGALRLDRTMLSCGRISVGGRSVRCLGLPHHPQHRHLGPGEEAKRDERRAHPTRDVHGEGIAVVEALRVAMPELREAQAAGLV